MESCDTLQPSMPADTSLLLSVPLFEKLHEDERTLLASQLDEVSFQAGQLIFKRGDPGGSIFIVAAGEVEIFVEDSTGERIVFETAKPGDFFGELSLLDGNPRSASSLAVCDTHTLRVDREDLQLLFTHHPSAAMEVLSVMGRRLRAADALLRTRPTSSSPNQVIEEHETWVQHLADKAAVAAVFAGSLSFLFVHLVWFASWVTINLDWVIGIDPFDPYPFGLLTMIVSLEAIFLSCMVLISQNRQGARDRIRSDAEYEANIRAGLEVTQLHVKIDALHEQLLGRLERLEGRLVKS